VRPKFKKEKIMLIPNRTEKSKNPQHRGLEKKNPSQHRESSFIDVDGQAAEALLHKIQSGQLETETVELSKIECHEYLKIRNFLDKDTIDELTNKMRGGQRFAPVILMPSLKPDKFHSIDAEYRLAAMRNLRSETTEAIVVDCTLRQGLLLRLMLNNSHAKDLSKREKALNIARLLKDECWKDCSDREIAGYCGSYGARVAKIRREIEIIASGKNSQIRRIFRRGCAPYYMDTSKINLERKSSPAEVDTGEIQTGNNPPPSTPHNSKNENRNADSPKPHKAELVNQKYDIQPGDVLVIYDRENPCLFYIIYCGDSTDETFFKICFLHIEAGLLIADIPWNVDLTGGGHFRDPIAHRLDKLPNDNLSPSAYKQFIHKIFSNCAPHLKTGSPYFVFFGLDEIRSVIDVVEDIFKKVQQTVVWYKWALRQNNSYFKEAHELAFFGWIKGALRYWSGEDSQITVLEEKLLGGEEGELPRSTHPCPKPVSVIRRLIELCLEPDGVVLDPVLGSGTTLLAAAQIGRSGVGVELVPEYVAIAVDRLINHFGEDRLHYHKTTIENLPGVLAELEDLKKNAIQNDSEAQIK